MKSAVDELYNDRRVRLWVVYVDTFSGQTAAAWARDDHADQRLRQPTGRHPGGRDPGPRLRAPGAARRVVGGVRRRRRCAATTSSPPCAHGDWAGAAIAAANGLNADGTSTADAISWVGVAGRPGRHRARGAGAAAVDAAPASASAARPSSPPRAASTRPTPTRWRRCPLDALDDLSQVDRRRRRQRRAHQRQRTDAWRSRSSATRTPRRSPRPSTSAKTTLAQAFNVRQILDDAVPETAAAAARSADPRDRRRGEGRPTNSTRSARPSQQLRDLVINAPDPARRADPADGRPDRAHRTRRSRR